jgi:ABC-type uncharacterized transport system permease subunit
MILPSVDTPSLDLAIAAAVAYAASALAATGQNANRTRSLALLAWLLHGLALAWGLFGGAARFGFAPALSMTVWLVGTIYAIESLVYPQLQTRWPLSVLGASALLLTLLFPGTLLHPSASFWLPLHWALGIASYGLFAVAVAHGWFMSQAEKRIRAGADPASGIPLFTLERLMFRFVGAGFILLSATIVVVWFFGEQLYGTRVPWRWDRKTVLSLLSWVTFAVLLLGRYRFGWRGQTAVRVLYTGAGLLLLAYVGSRFVIEVVLGRTA